MNKISYFKGEKYFLEATNIKGDLGLYQNEFKFLLVRNDKVLMQFESLEYVKVKEKFKDCYK